MRFIILAGYGIPGAPYMVENLRAWELFGEQLQFGKSYSGIPSYSPNTCIGTTAFVKWFLDVGE